MKTQIQKVRISKESPNLSEENFSEIMNPN